MTSQKVRGPCPYLHVNDVSIGYEGQCRYGIETLTPGTTPGKLVFSATVGLRLDVPIRYGHNVGVPLDEQQIELIGTAALSAALIREGFEIAHPVRDHGIDLIVFSDLPGRPFSAIPIQVKTHSEEALGISRKYEKFEGLVYAIVWKTLTQPRFFFWIIWRRSQFYPRVAGRAIRGLGPMAKLAGLGPERRSMYKLA